jgi:hypothetical protein
MARYEYNEFSKIGNRLLCPECRSHKQLSIVEVNEIGEDCGCKNVAIAHEQVNEDGISRIKEKVVGQCQCYSRDHL